MHKLLNLPEPSKGFHPEAVDFISRHRNLINNRIFASSKGKNDSTYKIEVESRLNKILRFGGASKTFKSVLKSRVKKFERALGKGVLQDIKKRSKQYPLIFG